MQFNLLSMIKPHATLLIVSDFEQIGKAITRLGLHPDEVITLEPNTTWNRTWREAEKEKVFVATLDEHLYDRAVAKELFDRLEDYHRYCLQDIILPHFFSEDTVNCTETISRPARFRDVEFDIILIETDTHAYLHKYRAATILDPIEVK
jgi:hypothetical protein